MAESAEQYLSIHAVAKFKRQAIIVWLVGLSVVGIWVAAIIVAPLARFNGFSALSSTLYGFFSLICHQISERSFHVAGEPFGVCSRCFGVYFGLLFGYAIYPLWRNIDDIEPLPRIWLFLSLIPITIDWSLTIFGFWENTQVSRFVTGLILGLACATFIVPAVVEISRNLSRRRNMSLRS